MLRPETVRQRGRTKPRRPALPVALTSEERASFSSLLGLLPKVEALSLERLLARLKARGVQLVARTGLPSSYPSEGLEEALRIQLTHDALSSDVRDARERLAAFVADLVSFDELRGRLERRSLWLVAPAYRLRQGGFLALLAGLARALDDARETALFVERELKKRAGKRRPRRNVVPLPQGIVRDDARKLRRATRLAAGFVNRDKHGAPLPGWTMSFGMPPRCSECGNPAPDLFRRKRPR